MSSVGQWYDRAVSGELNQGPHDTAIDALSRIKKAKVELPAGLAVLMVKESSAASVAGVPRGFAAEAIAGFTDAERSTTGNRVTMPHHHQTGSYHAPVGLRAASRAVSGPQFNPRSPRPGKTEGGGGGARKELSNDVRGMSMSSGAQGVVPSSVGVLRSSVLGAPAVRRAQEPSHRRVVVPSGVGGTASSVNSAKAPRPTGIRFAMQDTKRTIVAATVSSSGAVQSVGPKPQPAALIDHRDISDPAAPATTGSRGALSMLTNTTPYSSSALASSPADTAGIDVVPRLGSSLARPAQGRSAEAARRSAGVPQRGHSGRDLATQAVEREAAAEPSSKMMQPGSVVTLRGDVLMDGRKMGRLVAAGQISAASLPGVSASAVNLRAMPIFSGTSVSP